MSHHRYRNGKSSIGRARKVYGPLLRHLSSHAGFISARLVTGGQQAGFTPAVIQRSLRKPNRGQEYPGRGSRGGGPQPSPALLYDLGYLQVFAKLPVQARGAVLVPDMLVVRDTCEEMVAACRNVRAVGPFLPLQGHVTLFLFLLQVVEQDRHAVARGVLKGQRDEDESDTELSEVVPGDRILLVVPLERRRVVEGEARLRKALADLSTELLCRSAVGGRELAPQQVGDSAVHVPQATVDGELKAALGLRSLRRRHAVGAGDDDEVGMTQVVGGRPHHLQLADELVGRDESLAGDMAAA